MLEHNRIKLDSTVSFDLHPASILFASVKNARVLALLSAQVVMRLGFDAPAMHALVYPTLPAGTPNNYDKYQYLCLRLASGQETFIGVPWIKETTYIEEVIRDITLHLQGVSPDQQNRILAALSAIGQDVAALEVRS